MLKETVEGWLMPLVKPRGFRKQSLTWNRTRGEIVEVLDVQPARWNDRLKQEFTLNVGAVSKFAWETCWGKSFPNNVAIEECCPVFRIGEILNNFGPNACDKWWCLTADMDRDAIETVRCEVVDVLLHECLPWLDEINSEEDLLREIERLSVATKNRPATRIHYLILLAHNQRRTEAEQVLLSLNDPKFSTWNDRVLSIRKKLKLGAS
jgi:hypothetical protein